MRKKRNNAQLSKEMDIPSESSDTSKEKELLNKAIIQLTDEHKMLIILRFGQGLTNDQIAAILDIPEGTVRSRMHRTLVRLRKILGDTL